MKSHYFVNMRWLSNNLFITGKFLYVYIFGLFLWPTLAVTPFGHTWNLLVSFVIFDNGKPAA